MIPTFPNQSLSLFTKNSFLTPYSLPVYSNPLPAYDPNMLQVLSLIKLQNDLQTQLLSLQMANLRKSDTTSALQIQNKLTSPTDSISPKSSQESRPAFELPNDPDICLEAQVKYMIQFFINNYGILNSKEIENARQNYAHDSKLTKAFEALTMKYAATSKTREEMIKWIIRRVLKASKKAMKNVEKKDQKKLLEDVCKRYFKDGESPCEESEIKEDWVDSVLPFRKNSKNKTMNSNFIAEIFESAEFKVDYKGFLKDFDDVTEKENTEKMRRFTRLVVECTKKGSFESISKYKRVPWLKIWIKNTKKVAYELDEGNFDGKANKKVKVQ